MLRMRTEDPLGLQALAVLILFIFLLTRTKGT